MLSLRHCRALRAERLTVSGSRLPRVMCIVAFRSSGWTPPSGRVQLLAATGARNVIAGMAD